MLQSYFLSNTKPDLILMPLYKVQQLNPTSFLLSQLAPPLQLLAHPGSYEIVPRELRVQIVEILELILGVQQLHAFSHHHNEAV
jgi:hypothetical protein